MSGLLRSGGDCVAPGQSGVLRESGCTLGYWFTKEDIEPWLVARQGEDMGARTMNGYRTAAVGFCNRCVRRSRLLSNPFAAVPKAEEKADPRPSRPAAPRSEPC